MRPPRPWPSWRRCMSRPIASRSSASPAGRPSTMHVRPGPWDSPAVMRRRDAMRPDTLLAGDWSAPGRAGEARRVRRAQARAARVRRGDRAAGVAGHEGAALVGADVATHALVALGLELPDDVLGVLVDLARSLRGSGLARDLVVEDLDEVELVLHDARVALGDVEELRVAGLHLDRVALGRVRLAGAVARRRGVGGDQEHRGLVILEHADEDEERIGRRRQRRQPRDVVAKLLLARLAEAQVDAPDVLDGVVALAATRAGDDWRHGVATAG